MGGMREASKDIVEGEGDRLLHCGISRQVLALYGVIGVIMVAGVRENRTEWNGT